MTAARDSGPTSGPWEVVRTPKGYVSHVLSPGQSPDRPGGLTAILRPRSFNFPSSAEAEANARLIAAAPALLAACEMILTWVESGTFDGLTPAVLAMRAAVRQARGEG